MGTYWSVISPRPSTRYLPITASAGGAAVEVRWFGSTTCSQAFGVVRALALISGVMGGRFISALRRARSWVRATMAAFLDRPM
ncbi:hypothetical protein ADK67_39315 [Saccharothrix sp. NRRL B-16348]|nr:hypothetical protein ADK67_39315 [Saccharothrix sp. NRRL B-16348]